jgi:hypothetical protein
MRKRNLFCLVYFIFVTSLLNAQELTPFEHQHIQNAKAIPLMLIDSNIKKIGELDLELLVKDLEKVRWKSSRELLGIDAFAAGSGETRSGDVYIIEPEPTVYFNVLSERLSPVAVKPLRDLHMSLGALGYMDENYELSLALTLLEPKTQKKIGINVEKVTKSFFMNMQKRTQNPKYKSPGGATSVGGGGDANAMYIKLWALSTARIWLLSRFPEKTEDDAFIEKFYLQVLNTPFELDISPFLKEGKEVVQLEIKDEKTKLIRFHFISWFNTQKDNDKVLLIFKALEKIHQSSAN